MTPHNSQSGLKLTISCILDLQIFSRENETDFGVFLEKAHKLEII